MIDFREVIRGLSTVQLKAIRQVIVSGAEVVAERKYANADGSKLLKALAAENEQLKKANARSDIVEAEGLGWDEDYWMSFDDGAFDYFLNLFVKQGKELALSERTCSIKVPALISERELNAIDTCREGFAELKDRRNGHND